MNRVRTLIVGIGGIGCQIAATVYGMMSEEDKTMVGVVGIDTDTNSLAELSNSGMVTIRISENKMVNQYLQENPEFKEWFPEHPFLAKRGMSAGAGQVRALSRLAAISAERNGKFKILDQEMTRIMKNMGDGAPTNLTVMIVGSITGGTGAGMFIQLPLYIREAASRLHISSTLIRGMFIGADITDKVAPGDDNFRAVHVNDYACIKELNAFYLNQSKNVQDIHINIEHYDKINYPYDYLFLLQNGGEMGTHGYNSLQAVIQKAGEMAYFQLLTPIINSSLSAEDNFVLTMINKNGMNRYGSVGLSRIIYPYEEIKEYCTLNWINDLLSQYWLLLDQNYYQQTKEAQAQRKANPYLEMPDRQREYMKSFREECGVDGEKKICALSSLREEVFRSIGDEPGIFDDKAETYFDTLKEYIQATLFTEEIDTKEDQCVVKPENMATLEGAQDEVPQRISAYNSFSASLKKRVDSSWAKIISEILPGSVAAMSSRSDEEYSIYQLLAEVHPITARYLLYALREMIEDEKYLNEAVVKDNDVLKALSTTDFLQTDDEDESNKLQSAPEALEYFMEKKSRKSGIGKIFLPKRIEEGETYTQFKNKFKNTMKSLVENTKNYYYADLSQKVLNGLLNYIDVMIELYEGFFDTLDDAIASNKKRQKEITEKLNLDELGILRVSCSPQALSHMYYRLETECIQDKMALPVTAKQAVFREVYQMFVDTKDQRGVFEDEKFRSKLIERKKAALAGVFDRSIVVEVRNQIDSVGGKVLDGSIRQKIFEEYKLKFQMEPDKLEGGVKDERCYLQYIVGKGLALADPWVLDDGRESKTISAYVGINPKSGILNNGKPDTAATDKEFLNQQFISQISRTPGLLIGEEFSPYEIVCYQARYVMTIDEMIRYAENSDNVKYYRERLSNINGTPKGYGEHAYLSVINPHLCSYWNEEVYVPALLEKERIKEKEDNVRAFIYALALDLCRRGVYEEDESVLTWLFTIPFEQPAIMKDGSPIGNGYQDLYESIQYNRGMKEQILMRGAEEVRKEQHTRNMETIENDILNHAIISDLTHNDYKRQEDNLIDVLFKMRKHMMSMINGPAEYQYLCEQCIQFLQEYCATMLYNNPRLVNSVYKQIINEIVKNSEVAAEIKRKEKELTEEQAMKQGTTLTPDEMGIKKVINEFGNAKYSVKA